MDPSHLEQKTSTKATSKTNLFYGWYILAASFFLLFFQSGARFSFGVMFKPMIAEFGWNRASMSFAFFLNMTFFALTLSIAGRIYDRYGPKWVIFLSTVLLSAGFVGISFIGSLWQFNICYGIIVGIGLGGASVPIIGAMISKWFDKSRGLIISLAISGTCIGQFVLVPLVAILVSNLGWRQSHMVIGLIQLAINSTIVLSVFKGEPKDIGLKPFGSDDRQDTNEDGKQAISIDDSTDLNLQQAMRTASFWFFLVMMFICGSGDFLITSHLIPMVTDFNISASTAANMLAWFGLLSMGGILVAGPASDLIGNKTPIALTFVLRLFLFLLVLKYQNLFSFYVFAILFGFTFLITAPLCTTLSGKLYGFHHIGLISGFITTVHHMAGGFWAYVGGWMFDRTGSYRAIFMISALMALLALVFTICIKEKRHYIN